jgi:beta-glucosidase
LLPYYAITPFDGISANAAKPKYSIGCYSHRLLPLLGPNLRNAEGKVGLLSRLSLSPPYISSQKPVDVIYLPNTYIYLVDHYHPKLIEDLYWAEVEGYYTPDEDGDYEFGLTVHGTGNLYLGDELLVDNGGSFFNVGTVEEVGVKSQKAGKTYKLKVEYASGVTSKVTDADGVVSFGGGGIWIGGARVIDPDLEIKKVVELVKSFDQVIVCVGLNVSSPYVTKSTRC